MRWGDGFRGGLNLGLITTPAITAYAPHNTSCQRMLASSFLARHIGYLSPILPDESQCPTTIVFPFG
jgi:hypothetical protein